MPGLQSETRPFSRIFPEGDGIEFGRRRRESDTEGENIAADISHALFQQFGMK